MLCVVLDNVKQTVGRIGDVRRPHNKVVRVHVLEEAHTARIEMPVPADLRQQRAWVDADGIVPFHLDNDFGLATELVREHRLHAAVDVLLLQCVVPVHVTLGDARVARSCPGFGFLRAEHDAIQSSLVHCLRQTHCRE
jgi:hypothetical protein